MSTLITINLQNNSSITQDFFFFQQPAIYNGGPEIYSNSLLSQNLTPFSNFGSVYTFQLLLQYYAGVQTQAPTLVVGQTSGYNSAIQAIDLADGGASVQDQTTMMINPSLGLTNPVNGPGVQGRAFRIVTPTFDPTVSHYNAGSAVLLTSGSFVLSSFVTAYPNQNIDCQPVLKFYVQTGSYEAGTVMNFTSSSLNAALCDATGPYKTFNVIYNVDGTWTITPFLSVTNAASERFLVSADVANNTAIKNEAGTAVIATGYCDNTSAPQFLVQNLSNTGAIHLHSEYQVGPINGPFRGRICTAIDGAGATFS